MPRFSEFTSNINGVTRAISKARDEAGEGAAKEWARGMVQVMEDSSPQGLLYWYPGLGWTRASAPGQAPAIQTGGYARSITTRKEAEGVYSAGSPEMLGLWLEKGTSRMQPRPHVFRGYHRNKKTISGALYKSWEKLG
jgi:hypothetical protein